MMRKLTEKDLTALIDTVHNGYTIERMRVKGGTFSDSDHYGIVLGRSDCGNWVTWQFHLEDERPEYYWGHYIEKEFAAIADYEERS